MLRRRNRLRQLLTVYLYTGQLVVCRVIKCESLGKLNWIIMKGLVYSRRRRNDLRSSADPPEMQWVSDL